MRHLLTLFDVEPSELETIFTITRDLKQKFDAGLREAILPGGVLAMLLLLVRSAGRRWEAEGRLTYDDD